MSKLATELNTGDRIIYAGMTLVIVAAHNRPGFGTGVAPSPYRQEKGTDSEIRTVGRDERTRGRHNLSFAHGELVTLAPANTTQR